MNRLNVMVPVDHLDLVKAAIPTALQLSVSQSRHPMDPKQVVVGVNVDQAVQMAMRVADTVMAAYRKRDQEGIKDVESSQS